MINRKCLVCLWIIIAIIFLALFWFTRADGAGTYSTYLPIIQKSTSYFRITGADCGYIYVEAVNYPVQISTDYYAGTFTVRKYPSLPIEFGTLHYWPEQSNNTVKRYWGAAQFELGILYYLDAWIKCGSGQCWVSNGDQLWMPCKPHVKE